jgi:hypothetical protein
MDRGPLVLRAIATPSDSRVGQRGAIVGPELAWAGQTEKGAVKPFPSLVETRSGLVQVPNLARRHPEWLLARHELHRNLRHHRLQPLRAVPHHDHGADGGQRAQRFAPTLICFYCNIAEGRAKRMLKLPKDFSFSPVELSMFIVGYPHRRITEDLEAAKAIAESIL